MIFSPDAFLELLATLRRNKLRALLTALGVFWGVFMLIVLLGLGRGLERGTQRNFGDMLTRAVFVWTQRTTLPFKGLRPGRNPRFRNADIEAIAHVPGVEHVAPRLRLGGWREGVNVSQGRTASNFAVTGDTPVLRHAEPFVMVRGRFLTQRDLDEQRKVAVIGDRVKGVLFGERDPIGTYITVQGVHFQVVGILRSDKSGDDGERTGGTVFVPFTTFQQAFNQRDRVHWFALTAAANANPADVERRVRQALHKRHNVHPDDSNAFGAFNAAEKLGQVQGLFRGIRLFVWFVGSMTLFAGMLGVSNILLITVKERTREIGIRKALGATPWAVTSMVLREAIALSSLSGYLGIVAGVGALELIGRAALSIEGAPLNGPEVDLTAAVVAALLLVASGAVAGYLPARHAASISPVEALRAE